MYQRGKIAAMSDYTHINLKEDVDDQAPNFGLSPQLESRMARVPLEMENAGLTYIRIAPGYRIPYGHKHRNQEEVYVLVSGSARIKIEDEIRELILHVGHYAGWPVIGLALRQFNKVREIDAENRKRGKPKNVDQLSADWER